MLGWAGLVPRLGERSAPPWPGAKVSGTTLTPAYPREPSFPLRGDSSDIFCVARTTDRATRRRRHVRALRGEGPIVPPRGAEACAVSAPVRRNARSALRCQTSPPGVAACAEGAGGVKPTRAEREFQRNRKDHDFILGQGERKNDYTFLSNLYSLTPCISVQCNCAVCLPSVIASTRLRMMLFQKPVKQKY